MALHVKSPISPPAQKLPFLHKKSYATGFGSSNSSSTRNRSWSFLISTRRLTIASTSSVAADSAVMPWPAPPAVPGVLHLALHEPHANGTLCSDFACIDIRAPHCLH